MSNRILRLKEVLRITGLSRTSIYNYMGIGEFPASVSLGGRAVGWLSSEIEEWLLSRARQRKEISNSTQEALIRSPKEATPALKPTIQKNRLANDVIGYLSEGRKKQVTMMGGRK